MRLKTWLGSIICLSVLAGTISPGWADLVHFHNGKVLRGDVTRITGDIIDFKEGRWSGDHSIPRLQLTNRRDVVELRPGNKKIFGEVIYMDDFKLDMETPVGLRTISRLRVKNIVLGTPQMNIQQDEHFIESANQQYSDHPVADTDRHIHPAADTAAPRLDLDFVP